MHGDRSQLYVVYTLLQIYTLIRYYNICSIIIAFMLFPEKGLFWAKLLNNSVNLSSYHTFTP